MPPLRLRLLQARLPTSFSSSTRTLTTSTRLRAGATSDNPVPANDPNPRSPPQTVSETNAVATSSVGSWDRTLMESVEDAEYKRSMQAPNRKGIWSRSQMPREKAMVGPRFEQMIVEDQPRPFAAVELIHKQPVRWIDAHVVTCDGGGGPLGHPRIFINLDKPQIFGCTYCGLPFAKKSQRKAIEASGNIPYPLDPTGDPAEVNESQRVTDEPFGQR